MLYQKAKVLFIVKIHLVSYVKNSAHE